MKKLFSICAAAAAIVTGYGVLFGIHDWAGGNVMLHLGLILVVVSSILAIVCACKGLFDKKCFSITTGVSVLLAAVGIYFKMMLWPGGTIIALIALGVLLPVCAIWYVINNFKKA